MKRNENIVPLSRDHHHGLLFGWKVRQGIAHSVDPQRIRNYVGYFWQHHLAEHFQEEEELLFREVSDPLCTRALEEHRQIESLVTSIREEGARLQDKFEELVSLLDLHIRFEERQVFPFLEKSIAPARLIAIGRQLQLSHELPAEEAYPDPFWNWRVEPRNPNAAG